MGAAPIRRRRGFRTGCIIDAEIDRLELWRPDAESGGERAGAQAGARERFRHRAGLSRREHMSVRRLGQWLVQLVLEDVVEVAEDEVIVRIFGSVFAAILGGAFFLNFRC